MVESIIRFSLRNKLIVMLLTLGIVAFGVYSLSRIPIGAVPDITNNQVQVITTSRHLSTQDVEQFITYPVELEMANLPGVKEIRSISKFGLSVVTIVFEDDMGTYLPRQLIAEKIKRAAEQIPEGFGTPEMGPITTGLGEIYQYVLEVDSAYRDRYSITDLRTIQDWVVRRQLSGIPGVVEVNTWGGYLKQYQVSLDPRRLAAANITVPEVYTALQQNNSVAGGGYIEKNDQAYFIRGEGLVQELSDLEAVVITRRAGLPVYVRDVATVEYGHATRFGAITGNGEGEKVLGQVMMLKDANGKATIEAVKDRVAEISPTLPPGVHINPFLERSALIEKTTFTITENLVLGCLIVVAVVVLLLGNFRTGLVVASVIPLCLLFALSLMYIFGVDANLMSLGAIDFGIIIDGAVIIVEFIALQMYNRRHDLQKAQGSERQVLKDELAQLGAGKMMHSAIFGQLIIIIVFIPILSLTSLEGKMFRPMALTFCFALLGAMFLCFTYVPVIASMLLRPPKTDKSNISQRLVSWLQARYQPSLEWALNHSKVVLSGAVVLLIAAVGIFSRLGGEFVPTLDEGDFVIQPVLPTGTSLGKTIEITTHIEQVVSRFPEVDQVVTRIGAAEVPTDPMSMEETDVIITLHPPSTWQTVESKDALADTLKAALMAEIPQIDYEFTQPIEMRFNELITGVRADLAIKIFGEDLNVLAVKGAEVARLLEDIEGASDITVEKVEGLPQMRVTLQRDRIARYGLTVAEVNDLITMAFAGKSAGSVFEGERRFDLVVRFGEEARQDLQSLRETLITTSTGQVLPLSELAEIAYDKGPAKISRDDTKRRIVIGVNVRNRDLESVVDEARQKINAHLSLPAGYRVTYGGQFENLQNARARLTVAVPVALVLIFLLLYFAFKSIREALMVFSAIPLATLGGVLLLWLRGLPFSISAGVGFIALFGIAVLNGIVLIEHYKELRQGEVKDLKALIVEATTHRLRPVLLTAAAAALGFLPMAISTSAGAEVQRPLATVVVGGLVTATLLTLLVLPVLYYVWQGKRPATKGGKAAAAMVVVALLALPQGVQAQEAPEPLTLEMALRLARQHNADLRADSLQVAQQAVLQKTAVDLGTTDVYVHYDQNNLAPNDQAITVYGLSQSLDLPGVYRARRQWLEGQTALVEGAYAERAFQLDHQVSLAYYRLLYGQALVRRYQQLDSLYGQLARAAEERHQAGEGTLVELLTAQSQQQTVAQSLREARQIQETSLRMLQGLLQTEVAWSLPTDTLQAVRWQATALEDQVGWQNQARQVQAAERSAALQKQGWWPQVQVNVFSGTNPALNGQWYSGVQMGLSVPLVFGAQKARVQSARIGVDAARTRQEAYGQRWQRWHDQLRLELASHEQALEAYATRGRPLALQLRSAARRSLQEGEINLLQFIQTMDRAIALEVDYLHRLQAYNETALQLQYLLP